MAATATAHPLLAMAATAAIERPALPGLLAGIRRDGTARFEQLGVPTRHSEEWRFTSLAGLDSAPRVVAEGGHPLTRGLGRPLAGSHRLVLVDGWLRPELSDLEGLPREVIAGGLLDVASSRPDLLEPHLDRLAELDDHPFAALNASQLRDGLVLWLPSGITVDRPIELLLVASEHDRPTVVLPRVLIVAGRASSVSVVQRSIGGSADTLSCSVTEVVLDEGAVVDHSFALEDHADAIHLSATDVRQQRDSVFRSRFIALGGGLVRNDLGVALRGSGADASLDGLYLSSGNQHVDSHLRVHHTTPHCTSHQLYKGILDGRSRAVFNGRIVVDPGAQKTDARQSNRNLLLSDTALVNSNPQLEIFADDVRCTHGSTVGRLDEDAVFYLRSRGLDRASAESLLTWAFASEVVDRIRPEGLREHIRGAVLDRLPNSEMIQGVV
jgi:Fe-S cluster assembly protein SufD